MKRLSLFFVFILYSMNAQTNTDKGFYIEEPIFETYYKQNVKKNQEIQKLMVLNERNIKNIKANGFGMGKFQSKKFVEKITFELNGLKLYCSGKIDYKRGNGLSGQPKSQWPIVSFEVYPSSDVKYQSNNQIFSKLENFEKYEIKKASTLYNEDGSYLYHEELNEDNTITAISYYKKNELNFKMIIASKGNELIPSKSEKIGYYYPNYHYNYYYNSFDKNISTIAKDVSKIELENGDSYMGFSSLGTYNSKEFGDFTGYLFPMQENIGNATVLFREHNNQYQWVLVVDNQIEMTIPASKEEKPEIGELQSNLINTIAYTRNPKYENKPNDDYKSVMVSVNFGEYKSKNIQTLNGYGVNFYTKDTQWAGSERFLEIGFFKDGKLDGLGYSCVIAQDYQTNVPFIQSTRDGNETKVVEKVLAKAGIFKNGVLIEGRNISIANNNSNLSSYWTKNKVPGVDWIIRKNKVLNKNEIAENKIDYTKNTKGMVHVEKLGYNYDIIRIDTHKKAIVIKVDGKEVYLTKESGPVYYTYLNKSQVRVGCNSTKTVKTYKEIDVVKKLPGYIYETRRVKGAYGDYVYTTKTENTDTYTYKSSVFDGYKKVPNPSCLNGYNIRSINTWVNEEIEF